MAVKRVRKRVGALIVPPSRVPPKARSGPPCKLDDERFREALILAATTGMSTKGIALSARIAPQSLYDWLARGAAEPDKEPYGSFVRAYQAATRVWEGIGASATGLELKRIHAKAKNCEELTPQERIWLSTTLAQKYPETWGIGAASGRVVEQLPDGAAWLQKRGLQAHQLDDMFTKPPEAIADALKRNASAVVQMLVDSGWRPGAELFKEIGSSAYKGKPGAVD